LLAAANNVEEQFFLRTSGCALDHAADAEQMHVDCDRGRGASLRELLLAEREVFEVGAEAAVLFGDDEGGVSGRLHLRDVLDRERVVAIVLAGASRKVSREFRGERC